VPVLSVLDLTRSGIVLSENPLSLPPGTLIGGRNVVADDGRLRKRLGYTIIKASALADTCRFAIYFRNASGTDCLVACTHDTMYKYNSATNAFDSLATLTGTGENAYYDAEVWAGTLYLVKQGGDAWKWDGAAASATDVSASLTSQATYLRAFNSRLIGANCGAGTTQSIYWSAPLLPEDWAGSGSGNETRTTLRGDITGIELVGRAMAIFAEESIELMGEGPDSSTPFFFEPAEPTIGTRSPHSICQLGPPFSGMLVFLGSDLNIHTFNGYRAEPVADAIHSFLRDNLEEDYLSKAWGRVWPDYGVYRLAVPTQGSTENNLIIDWWYRKKQFYIHEFAGTDAAWSAASRWVVSTPLTISEQSATGITVAEQLATGKTIAEMLKSTGKREVAFLGSSGTFVAPFEGINDGSSAIEAWCEIAPTDGGSGRVKEVSRLEVLADRTSSNNSLSVQLGRSMDGANYDMETFDHTLGETDQPFIDWRAAGRYFKVRMSNTEADESFALRGLRLWGEVSGDER